MRPIELRGCALRQGDEARGHGEAHKDEEPRGRYVSHTHRRRVGKIGSIDVSQRCDGVLLVVADSVARDEWPHEGPLCGRHPEQHALLLCTRSAAPQESAHACSWLALCRPAPRRCAQRSSIAALRCLGGALRSCLLRWRAQTSSCIEQHRLTSCVLAPHAACKASSWDTMSDSKSKAPKFLKAGKVVLLLNGRRAGK